MIIDWNHILLDPLVFARHGTHRVARIPGGISAFPVGRRGTTEHPGNWVPNQVSSGLVPDAESPINFYHINPDGSIVPPGKPGKNARGFRFAFWSYRVLTTAGPRWGRVMDPVPSIPGVDRATAYFVWDFGGGGGPNGVYLDAFNDDTGEFLPDDFVTVNPDDPSQTRTTAANNGLLMTEGIEESTIDAYESLGNVFFDLRLNQWRILFAPDANLTPIVNGRRLTVKSGDVANAIAFYGIARTHTVREPLLLPVGWQHVISGLAGGIVGVIGGAFPWGGRPPGGPEPGDTFIPELQKLGSQVADLNARVRALESRPPKL